MPILQGLIQRESRGYWLKRDSVSLKQALPTESASYTPSFLLTLDLLMRSLPENSNNAGQFQANGVRNLPGSSDRAESSGFEIQNKVTLFNKRDS